MKKISFLAICFLGLLFSANAQEKETPSKQALEIRKQPFSVDRKDLRELIKNRKIDPRFLKILELRKKRAAPPFNLKDKAGQSFTGNSVAGNQRICNVNDIDLTNTVGEMANDPHIAFDPANPNNLIVAGVYTHSAYGPVTYTSSNRGASWSPAYYHSIPTGTDLVENPTSAFAPDGNLYMAYNIFKDTGNGYIMMKSSPTKGTTWPGAESPFRIAPFPDFTLGTALTVDYNPASPYYNIIYGAWSYVIPDVFGSYSYGEIGWSADGGVNVYSAGDFTQNFCLDPYVETGPAGELYVAWSDFGTDGNPDTHHIGFARLDVGATSFTTPVFLTMPPIEEVDLSYFNYLIQGTYPVIAVDKSGGPHNGRIYIVAASTTTFGSNHSDILMSYSDNHGDSWSAPAVVNQSSAGQCWNPWASVDNVTGELAVSYYCFENPYNVQNASVYVANSLDGGASFTQGKITDVNFQLSSAPAYPTFYPLIARSGIVAHNRQQNIAWIDQRNTNENIWKLYTSFGENHDITGPDAVCNCGVFSLTNLAPNATVTWSASPSSAVTITPGANGTATVCRVGGANEMITLSAVISGTCNNLPFTRQVMLGNPIINNGTYFTNGVQQPLQVWTGDPFSDINNVCFMQQSYTNVGTIGAATVNWTKIQSIPNQPISWNQNGNNLNFMLMSVGQTAKFRLTATNACGNSIAEYNFKALDCSGGGCRSFAVSPNPAKGEIRVNILAKPPGCAKTTGEIHKGISAVRIYDNAGNLKRSLKNNNSTEIRVNIRGLKTGVYIVEIADGTYTERQQVIIQE